MTDDPEEAVRVAKSKGLQVQWGPNRLLKTKYYADAYEYFEPTDKNIIFSSLADSAMWFDSWPLVQHLPYDERPLYMTYGDDTEFTREERELWIEAYDKYGLPLSWQPGDVGIVCNYRWAHGRPAIHLRPGEEREIGVVIGAPILRVGQKDDKW